MTGFSRYADYVQTIAARDFAIFGTLVIVAVALAFIWLVDRWRPRYALILGWALIGAFYATLGYSLIYYFVLR